MTRMTDPTTGRAFRSTVPVVGLLYLAAATAGVFLGGPAERTFALVLAGLAALRLVPPLRRTHRARRDLENGHDRV
ncbi:hypothetical protein [Streptomyces sp. NPDC088752]|uniref:hypothetical protein n=1 Tax=Streptomyces sp. NPDC088752 TaxID=3154963 RepID=UPI00341AA257